MKIRWTGEPRALADPQIEVAPGDEVDLDAAAAASFVDQGLADPVDKPAAKPKKENT